MVTRAEGAVKGAQYAKGEHAVAECPVCSLIVPYRRLEKDWRGVWVCPDCNDEPPAALKRRAVPADAEALHHAKPFLDDFPAEENVDETQSLNERPAYT